MPHVRNGHTWIANELIDQVFAKGKFSKRESQIIWVILRESWGWLDKRPKTIKKYGKEIRKYSITRRPVSYTQFSEKTGIAIPHIGETIRGLKARKAIKEHRGYYKFNKNYDGYQNSNQSYQNGNRKKRVTKTVKKTYRNGNSELPKRESDVTKTVTSITSKGIPKKKQQALKESKESKESIKEIKHNNVKFPKKLRILKETIIEIFSSWKQQLNHPKALLTKDRQTKISARLKEGYTLEQSKDAIKGCKLSAYHMGDNPQGRVYDSIELIFRNGDKIEQFINIYKEVLKHGKTGKKGKRDTKKGWEEGEKYRHLYRK